MTLSGLSIKRPVFAWMLMSGLIIFGAISLGRLGVSQMPDVDFPILTISVEWEGAAPEIMETEIVDEIEDELMSVEGVKTITSSVRQGSASVRLEFDLDRNIDAALQEVQAAIASVRLPTDVDPPRIRKQNPDDSPILWMGVVSSRPLRDVIAFAEMNLKDQFQILPGVGEITLGGYTERNLRVWVDNTKLREYELTILDVQKAVELEHVETAAGIIENDKQELNVRMMGEGISPEAVGDILISQRGGRPIYNTSIRIKDVARVEDSLADIRRISRVSGDAGIGLGFKKQRGANAVTVAKEIKKRAEELNKIIPKDIELRVNFDSTVFIEETIHETEFTLILSAVATGLVCWFFLASWSSTFNVWLSIPTSIIGTFIVVYFMGFTLNLFTLLALALAVGIVVDDAIMVLENIFRHLQMGKDRVAASRDGAREITFAAMAASVAVVAIFLPVVFMKGIIGEFFFQFGITIAAAVMLSLLEAITLTPMRCSQFLSREHEESRFAQFVDKQFSRLAGGYRRLLGQCLNWRWTVTLASLLIFSASLLLATGLRKELVPPEDQSMFLMRFQTPIGSSLTLTNQKMLEVENWIKQQPEVLRYFTAVGGFGGGDVNSAMMFVTLKPKSKRERRQEEFMEYCRNELKKIKGFTRITPQDLSMRGFSPDRGSGIEFNIRGGDWKVLSEKSEEILKRLEATGLVRDLDTDYRLGMPEARIWPDRDRAAATGVDVQKIGDTVNAAIGGVRQGKFSKDGRRYDVRLRLEAAERDAAEDIAMLQIRNQFGELVELKDVTKIETVPTLQTITRRDRERSISIYANIAPGKSLADGLAAAEKISREVLPEGYRFFLGGSAQTFKESFEDLNLALWLGILVAYMVLASQFNSFIHPVTVLLSLPFSLTGALAALWITDQSLNLYSAIGIILLMGIVKKNAILLVEFTNKKRYEEKLALKDAILAAGPIRLRPILMTSLATLAAAVPPALAIGPGAESRVPMAIAILGGVFVSTAFTLFVVPCAYSLFSKLERGKPAVSPG